MNERREQKVDEIEEILFKEWQRKLYSDAIDRNGGVAMHEAKISVSNKAVSEYVQECLDGSLPKTKMPGKVKVGKFGEAGKTKQFGSPFYVTEIDCIYGTFIDISANFGVSGLKLSENPILVQKSGQRLVFYEKMDDKKMRELGEICFDFSNRAAILDLCSLDENRYGLRLSQVMNFLNSIGINGIKEKDIREYDADLPIRERVNELIHDAYLSGIEKYLAEEQSNSNKSQRSLFKEMREKFRAEAIRIAAFRDFSEKMANTFGAISMYKYDRSEGKLPIDVVDTSLIFGTGIDRYVVERYDWELPGGYKLIDRTKVNSDIGCKVHWVHGIEDEKLRVTLLFDDMNKDPCWGVDFGAVVKITYSYKEGRITRYKFEDKNGGIVPNKKLFYKDVKYFVARFNEGRPRTSEE